MIIHSYSDDGIQRERERERENSKYVLQSRNHVMVCNVSDSTTLDEYSANAKTRYQYAGR